MGHASASVGQGGENRLLWGVCRHGGAPLSVNGHLVVTRRRERQKLSCERFGAIEVPYLSRPRLPLARIALPVFHSYAVSVLQFMFGPVAGKFETSVFPQLLQNHFPGQVRVAAPDTY